MSHGKLFTLITNILGPNGWKVEIVLQELKLEYEPVYLSLAEIARKDESVTKYNPNGRIPALIDHQNNDFVIWESCAIIYYLVEKYDKDHAISVKSFEEKAIMQQWLFFQASGQGPYFGQCGWFKTIAPDLKIPVAIERYQKEILRVFDVLESVLSKQDFLLGNRCTVADLAFVMWNDVAIYTYVNDYNNFDLEMDFPAVYRWHSALLARGPAGRCVDLRKSLLAHGKA